MNQLDQLFPPTLTDLMEAVKVSVGTQLNCVQVGIIKTFYPDTQSADIQFALQRVISIAPDGKRTLEQLPVLKRCPVVVLFGGNSFLSMPIAAGDNCLILFNDREMQEWYTKGGVQTPITYRTHDFSDGVAIVGIRNLQNSISDYISNGVRLSYSSNSRATFTDNQIATIANLFKHTGNMEITGNLTVDGNTLIKGGLEVDGTVTGTGGGGAVDFNANITLHSGKTISGGVVESSNGATGTFNIVTVANGIVVSGS